MLKDREADKQPVVSRATPSEIQVGCCSHRQRRRKLPPGLGSCWDPCAMVAGPLAISTHISMAEALVLHSLRSGSGSGSVAPLALAP